jgi:hypothetical protein
VTHHQQYSKLEELRLIKLMGKFNFNIAGVGKKGDKVGFVLIAEGSSSSYHDDIFYLN